MKRKKRRISKIWGILIILILITVLFILGYYGIKCISNQIKLNKIKAQITIPDNFYYVGGDVESGVVISDSKKDQFKGTSYNVINNLKGNQFVWVPVEVAVADDYDQAKKFVNDGKNPIAIKDGDNYKALKYTFDSYFKSCSIVEENESQTIYGEPIILENDTVYKSGDESSQKAYQDTFNEMVKSVEKNKGFYIGRFEAGNLDNAINKDEKITSKAGEENISGRDWDNMYKLSRRMYDKDNIQTEMIWGCQWNATLVWMFQDNNIYKRFFNVRNYGNFYGKLEKTGSNKMYCFKNIYDLVGNVFEWTQLGKMVAGRAAVGGSYQGDNYLNYTLSDIFIYSTNYVFPDVGTRVSMYVK